MPITSVVRRIESKNISPGYPRVQGRLGGQRGIPPKIICYVNSWVFNSGESKNYLHFPFRVPSTPARAPPGGGGAIGGIQPTIMCYVDSWLFQK